MLKIIIISFLLSGCLGVEEVRQYGFMSCKLGYVSALVDIKESIGREKFHEIYPDTNEDRDKAVFKACNHVKDYVQ